ncbi:DedA family protein [Allosaccharopolyspora coralli]|uniref:DedA family protein n=1 Tax=Allosaccharopolyspora coralli TaxID=2665642 RepID=A0A5Q3Q1J4_9PSEU|nr:DedA family protein [Allosaccharopolyspora coralli]QGK68352.1 DedA family protein [Allosaccharopolyspora coralli]
MIEWLDTIPHGVIYLVVGGIIGLESIGIPLPGEIMLISASVAAAQGIADPVWLGVFAATGAIIGDSIGYAVGHRYGRSLLKWAGKKSPKHFGPHVIADAEATFERWGAWAVFGGRFVALLRILAGPLAGVLRMSYPKFLLANASGAIAWVGTVTTVAYLFGLVAQQWISRASYLLLLATIVLTVVVVFRIRKRANRAAHQHDEVHAEHD